MNDDLPPLPEPAFRLKWVDGAYKVTKPNIGNTDVYTAAQVEAVRRAAVLAERERCAKVCEEIETASWKEWKATYNTYHDGRSDGAGECAAAIRKETT